MWRMGGQAGCLFLMLFGMGCSLPVTQPSDPLFENRKPIEAKARTGPPTVSLYSEPTPAANPYAAR